MYSQIIIIYLAEKEFTQLQVYINHIFKQYSSRKQKENNQIHAEFY